MFLKQQKFLCVLIFRATAVTLQNFEKKDESAFLLMLSSEQSLKAVCISKQ
jgi:hypothetical protein